MTLRVRERGGLCKVGHTNMASAQNLHSGVQLALYKSSSTSMATLSHIPWRVVRPVIRLPPRGGLDSEFPSSRTPAHDRQGFALSGRYARRFGPRLYWLFAANLYMCIRMHTHVHKHTYTYTYTYVCTHLCTSIGPPAIRYLKTRHTIGASYMLSP